MIVLKRRGKLVSQKDSRKRKWWVGKKFKCSCRTIVKLESGDPVESSEGYFYCPECSEVVTLKDNTYKK